MIGENFKMKALESCGGLLTKGKIYEFVNGVVWLDGRASSKYESFEDFQKHNKGMKVVEIVDAVKADGNFKVICIKDYVPGTWLTRGKVYEFTNGATTYDDGFTPCWSEHNSYESWCENNVTLAPCVKLLPANKSITKIQKITVKQKGDKVIAMLTEDGNFIKSANAKYNSNDALEGKPFDFEIGKKLAVKRLFGLDSDKVLTVGLKLDGKEISETIKKFAETMRETSLTARVFDWKSFKLGKIAVHCDTEEKAKSFLAECDANGIKWCSGGKASERTMYNGYKEKTSYCCFDGNSNLEYCYLGFYKQEGKGIVEYDPLIPSPTIIKQSKYEVGDKVKLVSKRPSNWNSQGQMDKHLNQTVILTKVSGDSIYFDGSDPWSIRFNAIEGKVIEPTIKEVKRHAKIGEYIKLTKQAFVFSKIGDVLHVTSHGYSCAQVLGKDHPRPTRDNDEKWNYIDAEYVVLEGYIPENKPAVKDVPVVVKKVKRPAKVGEWIETVVDRIWMGIPYGKGEIYLVDKLGGVTGRVYCHYAKNDEIYLDSSEYIVLENYTPEPTPEPFRKAKIGDKIKVVNVDSGHNPAVNNGDIQFVCRVTSNAVWTDNENGFGDCDAEYIIIEEPKPEVKRVSRKAEIGEYVEIIDGSGCTATKVGDIAKVIRIWVVNSGVDYITINGIEGSGLHKRYILLENYQPKSSCKDLGEDARKFVFGQ